MSLPNPDSGNKKPRVAFVVQRCGVGVNGGAETLCLEVARAMSSLWDVTILTTCAVDYMSWKNHFPPGEDSVLGVRIRRFEVAEERNVEAFNELSAKLMMKQKICTLDEQAEWMRAQGPYSPKLTEWIRQRKDDFDVFLFIGYLYATTYDNLPLVADRAILAPMAHDEWPIHFTLFDRLFALPKRFILNTAPEWEFLRERFFHLRLEGVVGGFGIERPQNLEIAAFRKKHQLASSFLLYCGRIDPSKGCAEMFEAFQSWQAHAALPLKLVLIGKAAMEIPQHPDIIHLGFVSEAEKFAAMAACEWLIMPSVYESLSIVLLETWAVGRPALVNARTAVLVDHCVRSNGGYAYENWDDARAVIESCTAADRDLLGLCGQRYVKETYTWDSVRQRYAAAAQPLLPNSD